MGLPPRPADLINVDPRKPLLGDEAHARMLERTHDGVTAWIRAADHQAYDLIRFLTEHGVRVPQDVSLVGFDGIHPPPGLPELTTIQIPFHRIGVTGGKRLLDLVDKRFDAAQHILLDCGRRAGVAVGPPRAD